MKNFQDLNKYLTGFCTSSNKQLIIGKSANGKNIFAYHFGVFQAPQVMLTAATHAREYISSLCVCEIFRFHEFKNFGLWIIPLVNPDGVEQVLNLHEKESKLMKSNSNLVDINVNFDANWGMGKANTLKQGLENFIGPFPNSEPETRALMEFAKSLSFDLVVNFHTKGEVIYYGDFLQGSKRHVDKILAEKICKITNFIPIKTSGSFGGFSDWCEMRLNIPALTIELGADSFSHPISKKHLKSIILPLMNLPNILESFLHKRSKNLDKHLS